MYTCVYDGKNDKLVICIIPCCHRNNCTNVLCDIHIYIYETFFA